MSKRSVEQEVGQREASTGSEQKRTILQKDLNILEKFILSTPFSIGERTLVYLVVFLSLLGGFKVVEGLSQENKLIIASDHRPSFHNDEDLASFQAQINERPARLIDLILRAQKGEIENVPAGAFVDVTYDDKEGSHIITFGKTRVEKIDNMMTSDQDIDLISALNEPETAQNAKTNIKPGYEVYQFMIPKEKIDLLNQETHSHLDPNLQVQLMINRRILDWGKEGQITVLTTYSFMQVENGVEISRTTSYASQEEAKAGKITSQSYIYAVFIKNEETNGEIQLNPSMKPSEDGNLSSHSGIIPLMYDIYRYIPAG
jgi:hypothetical protein